MAASSLMPEEEPRGMKPAGGGVVLVPPMLLDSEKLFQNDLPLEFLIACCLKLVEKPDVRFPTVSSSGISSMDAILGDDKALIVFPDSCWSPDTRISRSLSLTCLTTSASRRVSASAGATSSSSAARIRAKVFVFGYLGVSASRLL